MTRFNGRPPLALAAIAAAVLLAACGDRHDSTAEDAPPATTEPATTEAPPAGQACADPPPCGDDCSNYPFTPNDCWTTPYGPAKADVILGDPLTSTNMLYCEGGTYALCFFSGPPYPTGRRRDDNPPLPCVLEGDVANCTCQAYTSGPWFVDINGILNLGAYYETVAACGQDGSGCANIANCGHDGSKEGCDEQTTAPVCGYVQSQDPDDPTVSLIPGADLISTFSFAMRDDYQIFPTDCPANLYAGCMTAPCFFEEGDDSVEDGEPVRCECPTYTRPYQVGQPGQACTIPDQDGKSYVWSASYTAPADGGGDD